MNRVVKIWHVNLIIAPQADNNRLQVGKQAGQLVKRRIDDRTIFANGNANHFSRPIGKAGTVKCARQGQTAHHRIGHFNFRRNDHINRNTVFGKQTAPFCFYIITIAHTGDGFRLFEQRFCCLAGNHIHFIRSGNRYQNIGFRRAGLFQYFGVSAMPQNWAHIKRVGDALHERRFTVNHRDIIAFTGQMPGNTETDLAGPTNNDFHWPLNPIDIC